MLPSIFHQSRHMALLHPKTFTQYNKHTHIEVFIQTTHEWLKTWTNPFQVENYRLVSLLPFLSKVLESAVSGFLVQNNHLDSWEVIQLKRPWCQWYKLWGQWQLTAIHQFSSRWTCQQPLTQWNIKSSYPPYPSQASLVQHSFAPKQHVISLFTTLHWLALCSRH